MKFKGNNDTRCKLCSNPADRLMCFDTKYDGRINVFICERCFKRLNSDFKKGDIKEIIKSGSIL